MRSYLRIILSACCVALLPTVALAQTNICRPPTPSVPTNMVAEVARIQVDERLRQEAMTVGWTGVILPVKFALSESSLRPLCIFGIEVVPHPAMKLVALRAPKELMPAIEEALKRLDVPEPAVRSIELTGHVLTVVPNPDPTLMPVPAMLQPVLTQLKNLLPPGNVYLVDTVLVRGLENQSMQVNAGYGIPIQYKTTTMEGRLSIKDGTPAVVRIDNLVVLTNEAKISTNVEIPVGAQVVVGRAASTDQRLPVVRPVILVMSAKIEK
jgi:hypothetical protein